MRFDISVILTLHDEGRIFHRTLRALQRAVSFVQNRGKTVEIVVVKDRVSDEVLLESISKWGSILKEIYCAYDVDFGAPALSRNFGISKSNGDYIAILDGDDLFGEEWLLRAYEMCSKDPNLIAHPEFLFFFPTEPFLGYFKNNRKTFLNLIITNQWSVMAMAHRDIYLRVPSIKNTRYYAFQDWLWNCETAAHGYRHVIVPRTIMAVRQKTPEKSLWQYNYRQERVVRPNILYRKIFLMEYAQEFEDAAKNPHYASRNNLLSRLQNKLSDYVYTNHRLLYHALDTLLLSLMNRLKTMKTYKGIPQWLHTELTELSKIEPLLGNVKTPHVKRPGPTKFRLLGVINHSMAALVKAGKSNIYIIENIDKNNEILNTLHYMHALEKPVFVIITGKCKTPWFNRLPQNSILIDIGNSGLVYKERLRLMHRLLLESDPAFIHVFGSRLALEMFDRYSGTFTGKKIFSSFFCPLSAEKSDMIDWELSHYSQLLDFYARISTDLAEFRNHLLDVFGLPDSFIEHHRTPFAPWLFPALIDCENKADSLRSRSLLAQGVLQILCFGKERGCHHSDYIMKMAKAFKREGLPIRIDIRDFEQNGTLGLLNRHCFWNRYKQNSISIRRSKPLSFGAYDMILIPRSYEGNSSILIQAMGNGIPIMIQHRPGLKEIVNENTGWILNRDTEPEDINRVLRGLVRNPDIIHQKSKAARKFVEENHSWESFKQEVGRFYKGGQIRQT
jgi:glycosyltransferase involved in cell wall biosynthesis